MFRYMLTDAPCWQITITLFIKTNLKSPFRFIFMAAFENCFKAASQLIMLAQLSSVMIKFKNSVKFIHHETSSSHSTEVALILNIFVDKLDASQLL